MSVAIQGQAHGVSRHASRSKDHHPAAVPRNDPRTSDTMREIRSKNVITSVWACPKFGVYLSNKCGFFYLLSMIVRNNTVSTAGNDYTPCVVCSTRAREDRPVLPQGRIWAGAGKAGGTSRVTSVCTSLATNQTKTISPCTNRRASRGNIWVWTETERKYLKSSIGGTFLRVFLNAECKVRTAIELGTSDSECPHTDLSHDHLTCHRPSHTPFIHRPRQSHLTFFRPTLILPPSHPLTPSSPSKPSARRRPAHRLKPRRTLCPASVKTPSCSSSPCPEILD
ncbi:hypothetical protein BC827DRAFT_1241743 [Russula dissimulans]|nr:hypothetical protein BC827DRAFT_1241743 [Russula dissimulans]